MRNNNTVGSEANKSVLIVAKPGRIRDSVEALLRTMPQIKTVSKVDDIPTILKMIGEYRPDLILLYTDLPQEESWQILEYLSGDPRIKCLVLTDTKQQQRKAEAHGADVALIIGFKAVELFEITASLLAF